jgi:P2-related tail formation protein
MAGNLTLQPHGAQVLAASGAMADLNLTLGLLCDPDVIPAAPLTYTLAVTNEETYTATQVVLDHVIPVRSHQCPLGSFTFAGRAHSATWHTLRLGPA